MKGVHELILAWNFISSTSALRLADSFAKLSMLQVLDLRNATLGS